MIRAAYAAWDADDGEALVALAHPDIVLAPLLATTVSPGPWAGHDGIRRLLAESRERWAVLTARPEDFVEVGDTVVALVTARAQAREGSPVITGEVAHVFTFRDALVVRFEVRRDRAAALGDT